MDTSIVPKERKFGWELKPVSSVSWGQVKSKSGQICVVLGHSLLRGISTEMLIWWFKHFPTLKVTLVDIEGYENTKVPAYLLWHPSDHISVSLSGHLGPDNTAKAGSKIHIREVMQFKKYGVKYPVDQEISVFYFEEDGWGMGKKLPLIGTVMLLRISFKDVYEEGKLIGVQYHYEVVAGLHKQNFITRKLNQKIIGNYKEEFWEAWITHNTIEVGVFENFLPVLYEQRSNLNDLQYSKTMNPISQLPEHLSCYDETLVQKRLEGYANSVNAFAYQKGLEKSFL